MSRESKWVPEEAFTLYLNASGLNLYAKLTTISPSGDAEYTNSVHAALQFRRWGIRKGVDIIVRSKVLDYTLGVSLLEMELSGGV